jgi:hypothetical protein
MGNLVTPLIRKECEWVSHPLSRPVFLRPAERSATLLSHAYKQHKGKAATSQTILTSSLHFLSSLFLTSCPRRTPFRL